MSRTTVPGSRLVAGCPVAAFFLLALVLGAGIVVLVLQTGLPPAVALVSGLSASVSGVILTTIQEGRAGLKLMLRRLSIWRVPIGYWVFALFGLVPAVFLGSQVNPLFHGRSLTVEDIVPGIDIIPFFILFFFVAGLGQELGWTGYLLPRLQARRSALAASAIRALLAGIWHLPLLLLATLDPTALAGFPYPGWIAQQGLFVTLVVVTLLLLFPWAILLTWIFNSTGGSLLLVSVLHASEVWLAYLLVSAGLVPGSLDNYWGYAACLVLTAATVVLAAGPRNLSRRKGRITHAGDQDDPGVPPRSSHLPAPPLTLPHI